MSKIIISFRANHQIQSKIVRLITLIGCVILVNKDRHCVRFDFGFVSVCSIKRIISAFHKNKSQNNLIPPVSLVDEKCRKRIEEEREKEKKDKRNKQTEHKKLTTVEARDDHIHIAMQHI